MYGGISTNIELKWWCRSRLKRTQLRHFSRIIRKRQFESKLVGEWYNRNGKIHMFIVNFRKAQHECRDVFRRTRKKNTHRKAGWERRVHNFSWLPRQWSGKMISSHKLAGCRMKSKRKPACDSHCMWSDHFAQHRRTQKIEHVSSKSLFAKWWVWRREWIEEMVLIQY